MKAVHILLFVLLASWGTLTAGPTDHNGEPRNGRPHTEEPEPPGPTIRYRLSMPNPQTHYFEVEMRLSHVAAPTNATKAGYLDLKMPVWTPGSYLIREYPKNVEGFSASAVSANGQPRALRSEKIKKNAWRVYTDNDDEILVRYRVYAYELSVRTSFVDSEHGYVTPASMFLYHDALKNIPLELTVVPFRDWKSVTTALRAIPNNQSPITNNQSPITNNQSPAPNNQSPTTNNQVTVTAPNFDLLVDSPIEIGNQHSFRFTASGVPHTVAMFGIAENQYDQTRLAADYKRVCEAAASVVGELPVQDYTFIVHHIPTGGGGLEHLNSTTLETYRNPYQTESGYRGFLTLVAHEYFHLWNVKRIRPIALGPFDYETENYTSMLWWSEGVTSFYEDNILRRAGLVTPEQYLAIITNDINGIENQPGNRVQSAAEASMDAWIKYYRPNENSSNSTVSYYSKGSVLGTLLNLTILASTNGQRSLDDLMRKLYQDFYKAKGRGFTDAEFQAAASQVAGRDISDFFRRNVESADAIDYNSYFEPVGLKLVNAASRQSDGYLGASVSAGSGRPTITGVRRGSAAETDGLNVGDEVISVDNIRVGADDFLRLIGGHRVGDTVSLLVNRAGMLKRIPVTLIANPLASYRLEPMTNPTPQQQALYKRWLFIN